MARIEFSVRMDVDSDDIFKLMDTLGVLTVEELQGALKMITRSQFSAGGETPPDSIRVDVKVQLDPLKSSYLS